MGRPTLKDGFPNRNANLPFSRHVILKIYFGIKKQQVLLTPRLEMLHNCAVLCDRPYPSPCPSQAHTHTYSPMHTPTTLKTEPGRQSFWREMFLFPSAASQAEEIAQQRFTSAVRVGKQFHHPPGLFVLLMSLFLSRFLS